MINENNQNNDLVLPVEGELPEQYYDRIEKALSEDPDNRELLTIYADAIIDSILGDYYTYDDKSRKKIRESKHYQRYENILTRINPTNPLQNAIRDVINGRYDSVIKDITALFKLPGAADTKIDNVFFTYNFATTLKNGFPGMWSSIKRILELHDIQDGLLEMCEALETLYYSGDNDKIIDDLSRVITKNKDIMIATELLGYTYFQMSMWNNAISCFNVAVESEVTFFFKDYLYFLLALAYEKVKNYTEAEVYWHKQLAVYPAAEGISNDLGLCLYRQKQYNKAKTIFEKLVAQKRDAPYAAYNLVRCFLELGEYENAVSFIDSYKGKINKTLVLRARELRSKKGVLVTVKSPERVAFEEDNDDVVGSPKPEVAINLGLKHERVTNEKLLEDVLVAQIEKGYGAFGLPITIYTKKGDPFYGRQYRIEDGRRIDILAVDTEGDFFIIELKKDSGYGNVYTQIVNYMDWIKRNKAKKNQNVYGIICLNNPTGKLIELVRKNPAIRLFDYSFTYNEVM